MIEALGRLILRTEAALGSRVAPWVAGASSVLLVFWLWGGTLSPLPWVYDEAAYLLQARIFAGGHWAAPSPPLPEFFEQMHVFVTPALVPKYPPGHALLMVPGIWLGMPALIPLLLTGLTAGLLFAAARGFGGPWVGFLAWLIWITAPEELYLRPSYMSQISSGAVWLAGWLMLRRWRDDPKRGAWLVGFGCCAALGAVIRPVSAMAFLVVIGPWVLWRAVRVGQWRAVALSVAMALPVLAIVPWWSYATSGRAFPTPYSEYSRVYAPWNLPGFSVDHSPPERPETPSMAKFRREWLSLHEAHTVGRLPAIALERLRGLGVTFFGERGWRWGLVVGFAVGVLVASGEVLFGLAMVVMLIGFYLWIAARPLWTVYYLEGFPVLGLVTAIGCWRVASWSARRLGASTVPPALPGGLVLVGLLVAVPGTVDRLVRAKEQQVNLRLVQTDLARAVEGIAGKAVIFVKTGPERRPYESYVQNAPDLDRERVWIVQDRGPDNQRLLDASGGRQGYLFDPGTGTVTRWSSADHAR